jgi:hypothetical protein
MNAIRPWFIAAVLALCACPSGKQPPAGDGIIPDRPVSPRDGRVVEAATDSSALDRAVADRPRHDAPGLDAAQHDAPKPDGAHPDAPKADTGHPDAPKADAPHSDAPKADTGHPDAPKADTGHPDGPKADTGRPDGPKLDAAPLFTVTWYPNAAGTPGVASCPSGTAVAGGGACTPDQLSSSTLAGSGTWQTRCRSSGKITATYVGCGGAGVTVSPAPGGTCTGSDRSLGGECECESGVYGIHSYGYSLDASPPPWTCTCGQTVTVWSTLCAQVSGTLTVRTGSPVAQCAPAEFAVSGGCLVGPTTTTAVRVSSSVPDPLPAPAGAQATGWRCSFYDPNSQCGSAATCAAVVLCYKP